MRKQTIFTAFIVSLIATGAVWAQEPRDFSLLATQTVRLPGTDYSIVFNSPEFQMGEPRDTEALSVAVASWLSANFGLPTMQYPPRVLYAETSEIEDRQSMRPLEIKTPMENPTVYDRRSHTIYLPNGWDGSTPTELSIFVRQMVYHLQNTARHTYHCIPEGEDFTLAVQRRWLAMFAYDESQTASVLDNESYLAPRCELQQIRAEK